jgi:single-strand DNA-binding protein
MKQIIIAGGLTRDSDLRRTQNHDPLLGFAVGVSEGRDKPSTYFECSMFGKRGEALAPHLKKGARVTVIGGFYAEEYNGKTYFKVKAQEITLQGGKPAGGDNPSQDTQGASGGHSGGAGGGYGAGLEDQDIPFAPEWR